MSNFIERERSALALTLWGEARSEPIEGKVAVASVIRNRLELGRWGHLYEAVCHAPKQFSCWNSGTDANYLALVALTVRVDAGELIEDMAYRECHWIAEGCLSGAMQDRVHGASHYHVAAMHPRPAWAFDKTPICVISAHAFYRGIR